MRCRHRVLGWGCNKANRIEIFASITRPSPTLLRMSETSRTRPQTLGSCRPSAHRPELFPRGRLEVPSGPRPGPGPRERRSSCTDGRPAA